MLPCDVGAVERAVAPAAGGVAGDELDDLLHRRVDAFLDQAGDRLVGDATRHDVLAQVAQIGGHVEGEPVHRAAAREAYTDGADLARVLARRVDPHARVAVEPAGVRQAEIGEHVDHELLDRAHVGLRVGQPRRRRTPVLAGAVLRRQGDDRVADELTGAVVGDVAAAVHRNQFGTDDGRVDEHVGGEVGRGAVREHVRVLEQQQVVVVATREQRRLHGERFAVRHAAEPADAQGTRPPDGRRARPTGRLVHQRVGQSSASHSRVSMMSLILTRKLAE